MTALGDQEKRAGSRLPTAVAAVVALSGLFALAGWAIGRQGFRALMPGQVAMNPLTASCFLLAGVALFCRAGQERQEGRGRIAAAAALVIVVIACLRLIAVAGGPDLGLDQLLFSAALDAHDGSPANRMAPNTALAFLLLGSSLLALDLDPRGGRRPAQALALGGFLVAFTATVGYVFATQVLTRVSIFIPMALVTAMTFMLLAGGILAARPDGGVARVFLSPGPAGLLVRQLLPAAVLMLIVLGWLRLEGQQRGWFDLRVGVALMTLISTVSLGTIVLITVSRLERVDAERRKSEDERSFLASIVDSSSDAIVGADRQGTIVSWNSGAEQLYGYSRDEALGQPPTLLWPDDRKKDVSGLLERLLRGERFAPVEARRRRKDGSCIEVSLLFFPVRDASGRITGASSISRDITERKRAEEELERSRRQIDALHEHVRGHAERLEAANRELEAFSYSVSHDLRAPLRHVNGFADLLSRRSAEHLDDAGRRYLEQISQAARNMGMLIDDLLTFSRMGRAEMQKSRVPLGALVAEVRASLAVDVGNRDVEWVVPLLPAVQGDPAMLRLVFANLLGNAVKYTRLRPDARIEIGVTEDEKETVVFVRDNGAGFDMEYAHKLFGVFQRLHRADEFEGTGIGLANVRRIVTRHGGRTWAEGRVGEGATFFVSFPRDVADDEVNLQEEAA